jgi:hypothetical protein
MQTAGTGSVRGGLKKFFTAAQNDFGCSLGSAMRRRSAGDASPIEPVGNRCATRSSCSTASRFGIAINE